MSGDGNSDAFEITDAQSPPETSEDKSSKRDKVPRPDTSELQRQVLTAVRTAVSSNLQGVQTSRRKATFDLDFSLSSPEPEPQAPDPHLSLPEKLEAATLSNTQAQASEITPRETARPQTPLHGASALGLAIAGAALGLSIGYFHFGSIKELPSFAAWSIWGETPEIEMAEQSVRPARANPNGGLQYIALHPPLSAAKVRTALHVSQPRAVHPPRAQKVGKRTPAPIDIPSVNPPSSRTLPLKIVTAAVSQDMKPIKSLAQTAGDALARARANDPFFTKSIQSDGAVAQAERLYAQAAVAGGTDFADLIAVLEAGSPAARRGTSGTFLTAARKLLSGGHVADARRLLKLFADTEIAEVALAMGRSYDPNYLSTLARPDAAASPPDAERWYRRWHAIAVRNGQVSGGVNINRLVRAMRTKP